MTRSEAAKLRELATGNRVLEIGAWLGFSTVVMAQVAKHVVSVDWHREDDDHKGGVKDTPVTLGPYIDNLVAYGVLGKVAPIVAASAVALPSLRECDFDLVFIDGGHSYEQVDQDTFEAARLVSFGGTICWHDYDSEGVKRVVDEEYPEAQKGPGSLAWVVLP